MLRKMMVIILLMLVPLIIGAAYCVLQNKEYKKTWYSVYSRGSIFELFLLTIFCKIGTFCQWGMSQYICIYMFSIVLGTLVSFWILFRKRKIEYKFIGWDKQSIILIVIVCFMILLQMQGYIFIDRFAPEDGSVEIVNTMLAEDSFYEINPFTGGEILVGQNTSLYSPLVLFYAVLCKISGLHPSLLIRVVVPFWVLMLFASICGEYGGIIFKDRKKALVLIIVVQVLSLFGAEKEWLVFNFLLFKAWTQEGILYGVLLPMLILQCFYALKMKKMKEWVLLVVEIVLVMYFSVSGIFYLAVLGIILFLLWIGRKIYDGVRIN